MRTGPESVPWRGAGGWKLSQGTGCAQVSSVHAELGAVGHGHEAGMGLRIRGATGLLLGLTSIESFGGRHQREHFSVLLSHSLKYQCYLLTGPVTFNERKQL